MKTVKILGTGCPKCRQTTTVVASVIEKYNLDASVEKVEDITEIIKYNILMTPAVLVDDVLKISGKVPSEKEVVEALT